MKKNSFKILQCSPYLKQIPTVLCNSHDPAIVGMRDLVDEKSSLQQAWSLSPSEYKTNPSHIDVPGQGRASSQHQKPRIGPLKLVLVLYPPYVTYRYVGQDLPRFNKLIFFLRGNSKFVDNLFPTWEFKICGQGKTRFLAFSGSK